MLTLHLVGIIIAQAGGIPAGMVDKNFREPQGFFEIDRGWRDWYYLQKAPLDFNIAATIRAYHG